MMESPGLWEDFKRRLTEETEDEEMIREEFEQYQAKTDGIINAMGREIEALKKGQEEMIYDYVDQNMPQWARTPIGWFMEKGILNGDETGKLGLTEKDLRLYTVLYRAIRFVCRLMKVEI